MFRRIFRVFVLDADVFEEVGVDQSATSQAFIVVTIVALLAAISSAIRATLLAAGFGAASAALGFIENLIGNIIPFELPHFNPISAFFSNLTSVYVAWILWALVTWLIGEYVYKGESDFSEMLRIIGFSMSPRIIGALSFIPGLGIIVTLIGWIWAIIAGFFGIRQGLELPNGKTILTIVVSMIFIILINHFVAGPIFASMF